MATDTDTIATSSTKRKLPKYDTYPLPLSALKAMTSPDLTDAQIFQMVDELSPEEVMAIAASALRKVENYVPLIDSHPHRDTVLIACGKRWREMGGEMPSMLCVMTGEPPNKKPKKEEKEQRPLALGPRDLIGAIMYAAGRHSGQRRKNKAAAPYINHPIQVCDLLAESALTSSEDPDYYPIMIAAMLHDTIEDCNQDGNVPAEIERQFGKRVLELVFEVTDDKSLSGIERKRAQVANAPHKSMGAALIKLADKLSNLMDLDDDPPVTWSKERIVGSVRWTLAVVDRLPLHPKGADSQLHYRILLFAESVLAQHGCSVDDPAYDLERDYYLPFFSA